MKSINEYKGQIVISVMIIFGLCVLGSEILRISSYTSWHKFQFVSGRIPWGIDENQLRSFSRTKLTLDDDYILKDILDKLTIEYHLLNNQLYKICEKKLLYPEGKSIKAGNILRKHSWNQYQLNKFSTNASFQYESFEGFINMKNDEGEWISYDVGEWCVLEDVGEIIKDIDELSVLIKDNEGFDFVMADSLLMQNRISVTARFTLDGITTEHNLYNDGANNIINEIATINNNLFTKAGNAHNTK